MISNVTNKIVLLIKEWQNRPLQSVYAVVLNAIHYKVKQDGAIVNKAAYMVIGIDLDGNKDVLAMRIGENESSKFWLSVLNDLRNRGVQDILITCVDNLTASLNRLPPAIRIRRSRSASFTKSAILRATFPIRILRK